jgi:hypothetical protein
VSLFKPSVKALNPLNRLNAIFVLAVDRIAKSPYQFNWSMSSAIDLYSQVVTAGLHAAARHDVVSWVDPQVRFCRDRFPLPVT